MGPAAVVMWPGIDQSTGGTLGAMVRDGPAAGADIKRTSEPAPGDTWIGEMEAFPDADPPATFVRHAAQLLVVVVARSSLTVAGSRVYIER